MSVEISVPQLGESIVEATVGRWLKREGETVAVGDPLVELETEKVNMEVVSTGAGVLSRIVKGEGESVGVGDVLAVVDERAGAGEPLAATATQPAASTGSAPGAQNGATGAEVDEREVASATPLARKMAADRGVDLHRVRGTGPGGRVTQDDVTTYLAANGVEMKSGTATKAIPTTSVSSSTGAAVPPQGGAPTGGIARATAAPTAAPRPALTVSPPPARTPQQAMPIPAGGRGEDRVRMSRRRQTIARRLVEAQHTAAMLTTFNEVDMTAILELRKRRRDAFKERHGVGLGFMSFFTKAVIGALKAYPRLNAEIQGDEMVLKRYYDIGVAVSTAEGLVVPVVRDADRMSFAEIEKVIAELAERARANTLTLEELQGGTFTITNGGVFGSLLSTPILNGPQVGILGMHKIEERPIALNGQVVIHPMMYLAVSYDHRIVDGAEAVGFLVRVKELLEDPETLLLEA